MALFGPTPPVPACGVDDSVQVREQPLDDALRMHAVALFTGERMGIEFLQGKRVASLSGIAQPESFEKSLVSIGADLVYSKRFADHHRFTQQEVINAIKSVPCHY